MVRWEALHDASAKMRAFNDEELGTGEEDVRICLVGRLPIFDGFMLEISLLKKYMEHMEIIFTFPLLVLKGVYHYWEYVRFVQKA